VVHRILRPAQGLEPGDNPVLILSQRTRT